MNARGIGPELVAALKRLRLGGLLPTLSERLTLAEKESTPLEDLLLMLLTDEISRRDPRPPPGVPRRRGSIPTWCLNAGTRPPR